MDEIKNFFTAKQKETVYDQETICVCYKFNTPLYTCLKSQKWLLKLAHHYRVVDLEERSKKVETAREDKDGTKITIIGSVYFKVRNTDTSSIINMMGAFGDHNNNKVDMKSKIAELTDQIQNITSLKMNGRDILLYQKILQQSVRRNLAYQLRELNIRLTRYKLEIQIQEQQYTNINDCESIKSPTENISPWQRTNFQVNVRRVTHPHQHLDTIYEVDMRSSEDEKECKQRSCSPNSSNGSNNSRLEYFVKHVSQVDMEVAPVYIINTENKMTELKEEISKDCYLKCRLPPIIVTDEHGSIIDHIFEFTSYEYQNANKELETILLNLVSENTQTHSGSLNGKNGDGLNNNLAFKNAIMKILEDDKNHKLLSLLNFNQEQKSQILCSVQEMKQKQSKINPEQINVGRENDIFITNNALDQIEFDFKRIPKPLAKLKHVNMNFEQFHK